MKHGKDYIVFALDVPSIEEAQRYVQLLKGKVAMFKVGLELFVQSGPDIIKIIKDLGDAGVFLDLKFHDISRTVERTMERVAQLGVDLVTVHCASSINMLEMAVKGGGKKTGVLGVTVLTDNDSQVVANSGFREEYVRDLHSLVIKRAQMAKDAGCRGIVCSGHEAKAVKEMFGKDFLAVTPGIRPKWSLPENDDQQRITTPAMAVKAGADLIVVGRPIKMADEPAAAADRIAEEIEDRL
ncbi:Orotidine 5'-phosphate decarboxylase [Desulfamplus magnetovallimortis]|uniref:Orotidine 5'-phosphate decarboxylase n=1 Tax=Desulfamplus magnetovallimortis TaxID=1246637 RepID=A0A1W1H5L3_9BACT|nr:orotidine-5'-phosphate decarboxylase [Desulfamplus magnetovallimortis]SLM27742.1 Orotidine 5'-phosphate decarboxylase [Desulfamplus magnetovallimortis]